MVMSLKLKPGKQRYVNYVSGRKKVAYSIYLSFFVQFMVLFDILEYDVSCKLGCVRQTKLARIKSNSVLHSRFITKHYSTEIKYVNLSILSTTTC